MLIIAGDHDQTLPAPEIPAGFKLEKCVFFSYLPLKSSKISLWCWGFCFPILWYQIKHLQSTLNDTFFMVLPSICFGMFGKFGCIGSSQKGLSISLSTLQAQRHKCQGISRDETNCLVIHGCLVGFFVSASPSNVWHQDTIIQHSRQLIASLNTVGYNVECGLLFCCQQ